MTDTAALARLFLATLEARDWEAWERLLSPDVVYEVPQSRERIRGRAAYRLFNETYPGDWHLTPKVVIGDSERAVVWFRWDVGDQNADGQVFLEVAADGLITWVTDFWPEAYEPPERPMGLVERW
ncbi:MAG: nuclear transport factor 2 family protein [Nocardioides sp.]